MKFGCIGCGKMGYAIVRGITTAALFYKTDISIYEINPSIIQKLTVEGFTVVDSYEKLFESCDVILLAIKPQEAKNVIDSITDTKKCSLIISIMAGVPITAMSRISPKISVVRVMPNTCAVIGESASSICYSANTTSSQKQLTQKIFSSIGEFVEIEEKYMDDIIPIGGSFTAYAYYFMKAFIDSSVKRGIDKDIAKKLVIQSMLGSAKMVSEYGDIDKLIENVCSKGGTTLAGLDKLIENDFENIIDECAKACANRSKELGKI